MRKRAGKPWFSQGLHDTNGTGWVVSVRYHYDPGETVTVLNSLNSFPTEDEASAFVAETNGQMQ